MSSNALMKLALEKLPQEDAIELRTIVRRTIKEIKGKESGVADTTALYFQVEPFAREFDEFTEDPKNYGYSPEGRWINNSIGFIGGSGGVKRYRAMMFAWLSYYHPDVAEEFCKNIGVDIPPYQGDPDITICSDKADALFVRREIIEQASEPALAETIEDIQSDQPTEIQHDNLEPKIEETPEIKIDQSARGNRSKAAIILIALIGTVGAFAAVITYTQSTTEERNSSPATGANLETLNSTDGNEQTSLSASEEEADNPEPDISNEPNEEPEPPAPIKRVAANPVWDKISGNEWSTRVPEYFNSFVRQSNKQQLLDAASNGNKNAQVLAAIGYHEGIIGETNHQLEMARYLQPACNKGHARACLLVGDHFRMGWGYPENLETASAFYRLGCKRGNALGCHYLTVKSLPETRTPQALKSVQEDFEKYCAQGVGMSCIELAKAYALGDGLSVDLDRSQIYFEKGKALIKPLLIGSYSSFRHSFAQAQAQAQAQK